MSRVVPHVTFSRNAEGGASRSLRPVLALLVLVTAVLALASCGLVGIFSDGSGELSILIEGTGSKAMSAAPAGAGRTIAPSLDMTPASYVVTGRGPGGRGGQPRADGKKSSRA